MEHSFKKMMLVNPSAYKHTSQAFVENKLGEIDGELSEILKSTEPDDVKVKKYLSALKTHKTYITPKARYIDPDSEILNEIPAPNRTRAKELLGKLKPYLRWNDDREIIVNEKVVPLSNIGQLLNEMVTPDKPIEPVGWEEFSDVLKRTSLPEDLIINESRKKRVI